jgi:hypothetical protein
MEMILSLALFREYDGYIADHNGSKCTYREAKNRGWVLERDENEPCIKTLGYYQWIPFVLFLQVIHPD